MSYPRKGKPHPADTAHDAEIARAVSFTVHFRRGPYEVYRAECATHAEAEAKADGYEQEFGQYGRRAIVYAVNPEGRTFPIARPPRRR